MEDGLLPWRTMVGALADGSQLPVAAGRLGCGRPDGHAAVAVVPQVCCHAMFAGCDMLRSCCSPCPGVQGALNAFVRAVLQVSS
jgi:hypothetical protein